MPDKNMDCHGVSPLAMTTKESVTARSGYATWQSLSKNGFTLAEVLITLGSRVRRFDAPLKAFTLAEVLITLVIVGIIAAITVPMIQNEYKKRETVSKLKKTYSTLAQMTKLSQLDNGPVSEWYENSNNSASFLYNTYFKPYLRHTKLTDAPKVYDSIYYPYKYSNGNPMEFSLTAGVNFILDDGVFVNIVKSTHYQKFIARIDLNAGQKPNRLGRDVFTIEISNKGITPGCTNPCTESEIKFDCSKNSKAEAPGYSCLSRIMNDGWEIKGNYPW